MTSGSLRPKSTHEGELKFPITFQDAKRRELHAVEISVDCANLDNGMRVLSESGFLQVMGRSKAPGGGLENGSDKLPVFLSADNLKPFIDKHLTAPTNPVWYTPMHGGKAKGYLAELLPQTCQIYWEANRAGVLRENQQHIAERCEAIIAALINVAIVALVDEATGYQDVRPKTELQAMLEMYLRHNPEPWKKKFIEEFYIQIYRLKQWEYNAYSSKRSPLIGKITIDVVYSRIQPELWNELLKRNPDKKRYRYHQFLTKNIGSVHLRNHLRNVIRLMSICNSWNQFKVFLDRMYPVCGVIQMDLFFDLLVQSPEDFERWQSITS